MEIRKVGYRFRPDLKALMKALQFKAKGGDMSMYPRIRSGDIVEMLDLYGEGREPWNVFSGGNEISELHDVNDWQQKSRVKYIVTKLIKSGPKNYCRSAGAGSWDGQGTRAVEFEDREIFQMGTLTYTFRGDPNDAADRPHYWMHEYHLSQHSLAQIGLTSTDYVICRVIKDLSKRCHIKRGKKRATSSTATIKEGLPKKKAKKSTSSSTITIAANDQLHVQENVTPQAGLLNQEEYVEQLMTLDDVSDLLIDDCFAPRATCSSEKKAFLETPDCAEICDPGVVIDEQVRDGHEEENVVGCSSDLQNDHEEDKELTMDEFADIFESLDSDHGEEEEEFADIFESLDNDHGEEEEESALDEHSGLLFGNQKDLDQCFSSEFMESVRESDIICGDLSW